MPDAMDQVQQLTQDLTADALAAHARRTVAAGLTHCINQECGDAIAPARMAMGAQRCINCQHEYESRAAHFAAWGRR